MCLRTVVDLVVVCADCGLLGGLGGWFIVAVGLMVWV